MNGRAHQRHTLQRRNTLPASNEPLYLRSSQSRRLTYTHNGEWVSQQHSYSPISGPSSKHPPKRAPYAILHHPPTLSPRCTLPFPQKTPSTTKKTYRNIVSSKPLISTWTRCLDGIGTRSNHQAQHLGTACAVALFSLMRKGSQALAYLHVGYTSHHCFLFFVVFATVVGRFVLVVWSPSFDDWLEARAQRRRIS